MQPPPAARRTGGARFPCGRPGLFRLIAILVGLAVAPVARAGGIVALAPSAVEIVAALGAADRLAGVCAQCDYPPAAVAGRPSVGSYVTPSVEAVVGLAPDLVLAVPSPGNRQAVRALADLGLDVLVVRDRTLGDLWDAIDAVAARLGVAGRGAALAARVRADLARVRAAVRDRPRPTVVMAVGHRPLIVAGAGTLQDELIEIAGGANLGRRLGAGWPTLSLETFAREPPDVVVDAAMGSEAGLAAMLPPGEGGARPRIVRVPIDLVVRAGPRVGEAARALARALHPEAAP